MAKREVIAPANVHPARGYSHAVKVENMVFVAGTVGWDMDGKVVSNDIQGQAEKAMDNLKKILEAAGATMQDIVQLRYYYKNLEDMGRLPGLRRKYFGDYFPPTTGIIVKSLAFPDLLLEVEAIAVIGGKG